MPFIINFLANVCQAGYFVPYNGLAREVVGYPVGTTHSQKKFCDKGFGLLALWQFCWYYANCHG